MAPTGPGDPVDERLAAAGLPPLPRTAWLEIDLDALVSNLALVRAAAGAGVAVRPVVKADAYGHGALPVARALVEAGVDGLCVATLDEALALRAGRIRAPVLVLYPIPPAWAPDAARRGIGISAGDPDLLAATLAALRSGRRQGSRRLRIELEVETGLGRGGFDPAAIVAAAEAIRASGDVVVGGLWTHLQAPEDHERTDRQLGRFEDAAAALRGAGIRLPARHASASVGLLTVADGLAAYDGVRPGLAIYGLAPEEIRPDHRRVPPAADLRPVLSLHARPVRVADLTAGWGISYGPTFVTARPSRIATLPLGYGDGWPRSLSNKASALVRGHSVPLVGNVAMDAVMADVTEVPGPPVGPSDVFTLIGRQGERSITVTELAQARTTNSWEVVTAMSARLPRVYYARPGPMGLRTLTEWS
jgi:alanine racemase